MAEIEYLANLAEIVGGLTVVGGIVFGILGYRQHKAKERSEARARLARSFQTPELAVAIRILMELPGSIDTEQFNALSRRQKDHLWVLFSGMESIGILVYRGDLPIDLVDEFFSIPAVEGWQRLRPYVEELRSEIGREQAWEWYQWLAERLEDRHRESPRVPAQIAHRDEVRRRGR